MAGRLILTMSALVLFVSGCLGLFLADAIGAHLFGSEHGRAAEGVCQLAAAGPLGFAITNWMARDQRIGGIYARPLTMGNALLFAVASSALARTTLSLPERSSAGIIMTAVFGAFALAFVWLAFGHDPLNRASAPHPT